MAILSIVQITYFVTEGDWHSSHKLQFTGRPSNSHVLDNFDDDNTYCNPKADVPVRWTNGMSVLLGCQLNMAMVDDNLRSGMATYRLICFHDLFKRELLNTKIIAQMILLLELAVTVIILSLYGLMYSFIGWEKAMFFQFCMNLGTVELNTILEYAHQESHLDESVLKVWRIICHMSGQALFIAEFAIYSKAPNKSTCTLIYFALKSPPVCTY